MVTDNILTDLEFEDQERRAIQGENDLGEIPGIKSGHYLINKEFYPISWAVSDIIPVGLGILGGRPKVGKSWLALQLCLSVASGWRFLDQNVNPGRVLYMALEDSERRLKNRMEKQGWPNSGIVYENFDYMAMGEFFDTVGTINKNGGEFILNAIRIRQYKIVIVDTFSQSTRADQQDHGKMMQVLQPLQLIAHDTESSIILVDHLRKINKNADIDHMDVIEEILGSTAKAAAVDSTYGLFTQQGRHGAQLKIKGKDIEPDQIEIVFDPLTGCWQRAEIFTEQQSDILVFLVSIGEAVHLKAIAEAVGRHESTVFNQLTKLIKEGMVKKTGFGRGNVKYQAIDS